MTDTCCVLQRNEKKKWVDVGLRIMKAVLQQTYNRKSSIFSFEAVLKPGDKTGKKKIGTGFGGTDESSPFRSGGSSASYSEVAANSGFSGGELCDIVTPCHLTQSAVSPAPHIRSRVTPQPQE